MSSDVETKACTRCGETKPVTEYWRDASKASGRYARCAVCQAETERNKRKRYNLTNKSRLIRERTPIQSKARTSVRNAVARGKLAKMPCFLCGDENSEGHHLNYDFPLHVIWLCRKHHKGVHNEIK